MKQWNIIDINSCIQEEKIKWQKNSDRKILKKISSVISNQLRIKVKNKLLCKIKFK